MAKKTGYSASTAVVSGGSSDMVTAAAAVIHGETRCISAPSQWGSSTVDIVPRM